MLYSSVSLAHLHA